MLLPDRLPHAFLALLEQLQGITMPSLVIVMTGNRF